ncbi:hypothetical protein KAR91_27455 [Candidatus Pacearchaeota archaeon]|nr:hypothetical protein [Candidatus Pacearchaeota archaeon]
MAIITKIKIIRNRAKCNNCLDVVESKYRYDLQSCSCGNLAVKGGRDYRFRITTGDEGYEDLSEVESD